MHKRLDGINYNYLIEKNAVTLKEMGTGIKTMIENYKLNDLT